MTYDLQAVILCGGLGTRISKVVKDVPKSLIRVSDDTRFLDILINFLGDNGINEIIFCVGFKQDQIIDHITKREKGKDFLFKFSREKELLGTGGAVKNALPLLDDGDFILMNGDSFTKIDLTSFIRDHKRDGRSVSILVKKVLDSSRYGSVLLDDKNLVTGFQEKTQNKEGYINLGVYIISKTKVNWSEFPSTFSFEREFLPKMCNKNTVKAFITDGYFIDIGVPEDLMRFRSDLRNGLVKIST